MALMLTTTGSSKPNPKQMQALHYPFPISKASMQAVGTMHTWPTLLASITWIVELLTYDEEVQSAQAGQDPALAAADDERAEEKLLFEVGAWARPCRHGICLSACC